MWQGMHFVIEGAGLSRMCRPGDVQGLEWPGERLEWLGVSLCGGGQSQGPSRRQISDWHDLGCGSVIGMHVGDGVIDWGQMMGNQ